MTGIIPLDQWPEWADRHCWNENAEGRFYGVMAIGEGWMNHSFCSNIPMPAGHDWRVPVMRPTCKDSLPVAPAIDLEQFREAVCAYRLASLAGLTDCEAHGVKGHSFGESIEHADRLLALIDGRVQPFNGELRPDDLAVESWPPPTGFQLGMPRGIKMTHKPTGTVVTCDTERSQHANRDRALDMLRAKLQPAKGEGVAGE